MKNTIRSLFSFSRAIPRLWQDSDFLNWSTEARLLKWLTFFWLSVGLITLFSASYPAGMAESGDGFAYIKRQLIGISLGMVGFTLAVKMSLQKTLKFSAIFFFFFLVLILMTKIPGLGKTTLGASRWIFGVQPSELIKPFLVMQSALLFGKWEKLRWQIRLGWLAIFGVVLGGILIQPNLSTTALCGMTVWLIALSANLPWRGLLLTAFGGVGTAILSLSLNTYQWKRVVYFLDPWQDRQGNGYQLVQSLLTIGSGGGWGSGFGMSQQKLFYLPIRETDFIFSIFAEEFGYVGCILFLIMLLIYGTIALRVVLKCQHPVKRLIAIGVTIIMLGQSLLNIGVASGALPTTGLPLPLFSYGSSSMVASLFLAGLLIRVARESSQGNIVSLRQK
jgi:cell division protein FtsW